MEALVLGSPPKMASISPDIKDKVKMNVWDTP